MKRMIRKTVCLIIFTVLSSFLMAQNNAIFKGGNSDGWDAKNYQQISSNIFKGGNADGWASLNYSQQTGNIFKGGAGDGWDSKNYIPSTTSIFKGGIGDGWDSKGYIQISTGIFKGGNGDGWDSKNYVQQSTGIFKGGDGDGWDSKNFIQLSAGIFKGGIGDGWASNYIPMSPIPVTFLYFNAHKQGEIASVLNWKTSQEINSAYFDVERSSDAVNFIAIGRVNAAGNSQVPVAYFFTDNSPLTGFNYYRLKQVDIDGHFILTPARVVRFDNIGSGAVKYYPNPTNGLLNIELPVQIAGEIKVVNITNAAGIVLNQFKLGSSSNPLLQLDLGKYPKGIYFIQVKTNAVNSTQRIVLQ